MKKSLLLIVMVFCITGVVLADNYFSFENNTGVGPWKNISGYGNVNATISISSAQAHTGSASLLAFATLTNNQKVDVGLDNGYIGTSGDTVYKVWLFTPAGTPTLFAKISFNDSPGYAYFDNGGANLVANTWTLFSLVTTFGNKPLRRYVVEAGNFSGTSANVSLFIDDAEISGSSPIHNQTLFSFEGSTQSWNNFNGYGNATASLSSSALIAHAGSNSLQLAGPLGNGQKFDVGIDGTSAVGNGSDTVATAWVFSGDTMTLAAGGVFFKLTGSDNGFGFADGGAQGVHYSAISTWQKVSWDVSSFSKPFIRFGIEFDSGAAIVGPIFVDDVSLSGGLLDVKEWQLMR